MNTKNIFKGILLTFISLSAGLLAIGLPFKLFTNLSEDGLRLFFAIEIAVYIFVGAIFLIAAEKKNKKRIKEKQRLIKRQEKIDSVIENWYNIAA